MAAVLHKLKHCCSDSRELRLICELSVLIHILYIASTFCWYVWDSSSIWCMSQQWPSFISHRKNAYLMGVVWVCFIRHFVNVLYMKFIIYFINVLLYIYIVLSSTILLNQEWCLRITMQLWWYYCLFLGYFMYYVQKLYY